jgi:hypothetical protein
MELFTGSPLASRIFMRSSPVLLCAKQQTAHNNTSITTRRIEKLTSASLLQRKYHPSLI